MDYRKLNAITKKDAHPLPNIQEIFDMMVGSKVFSTLDLRSGYHQMEMDEDSKEKTAFICHRGLYQYRRLPFGLTNVPSEFQRFMNKVLAPFLGKFVAVFIDDIVVYSMSKSKHEKHLMMVFNKLQEYNLTLKPSKCSLNLSEVKLLGYIIGEHGIRSNPEKVETLKNMAKPTNVKGVRQFLGLSGYYRTLVPNYAKIAQPLHALTKKRVPFIWGEKEENSWNQLKDELSSDRIMAYPDPSKKYKLYTDACDYACGAILVQTDENG